jgi:propanol-preferring alcohol dehydrogenase
MALEAGATHLRAVDLPTRAPGPGEVGIFVRACGVCRTDLHIIDGDLKDAKFPIVPGHEIIGDVAAMGPGVTQHSVGDRVGVPWLGATCGTCSFCSQNAENLCDDPKFTGYQIDGGYAEYTIAKADYCFPLDPSLDCISAAPLLCAGLIGYRSYKMTGNAKTLGIYGVGAAAHILIQVAVQKGCEVYGFTRPGDDQGQAFARSLGAVWAGPSDAEPPVALDAAIIFAPVGSLVPRALRATRKGGIVVCGGIHMSDIPQFPYDLLWGERSIKSVANLTRKDGREFLSLASKLDIQTTTHAYPLARANDALNDLRTGAFEGAAVLVP